MPEEVKIMGEGAIPQKKLSPVGIGELGTVKPGAIAKLKPSSVEAVKPAPVAVEPPAVKHVLKPAKPVAAQAPLESKEPAPELKPSPAGGTTSDAEQPSPVERPSPVIRRPGGKKSFATRPKKPSAIAGKKVVPAEAETAPGAGEGLIKRLPPPKPRCWWAAVLLFWALLMAIASVVILYVSLLEKDAMPGVREQVMNISATVSSPRALSKEVAGIVEEAEQKVASGKKAVREISEGLE